MREVFLLSIVSKETFAYLRKRESDPRESLHGDTELFRDVVIKPPF